jgi:hypothetical protein
VRTVPKSHTVRYDRENVASVRPRSSETPAPACHETHAFNEEGAAWTGLDFAAFHPSATTRLKARFSSPVNRGKLRVVGALGTGDPARLTQFDMSALVENEDQWKQVSVSGQCDQQDDLFWGNGAPVQLPLV